MISNGYAVLCVCLRLYLILLWLFLVFTCVLFRYVHASIPEFEFNVRSLLFMYLHQADLYGIEIASDAGQRQSESSSTPPLQQKRSPHARQNTNRDDD